MNEPELQLADQMTRQPHVALHRRLAVSVGLVVAACTGPVGAESVPTSTATETPPSMAKTLEVTADGIALDGVQILVLNDGLVPTDKSQGQLIPDLHDALRGEETTAAESEEREASPSGERILVQINPQLTAGLLSSVLHTASAAGYTRPWLVVAGPEGRAGIAVTTPTRKTVNAVLSEEAAPPPPQNVSGWANPLVSVRADKTFLLEVRDDVYGSSLRIDCGESACEDWPIDRLNRIARRLKLDHPRDRAVLVQAEDVSTVQSVVDALDATRSDAPTGRGARELFPEAIFTGGLAP